MKVIIVAKTRRGGGACVGGITEDGRSVRLVAADAATNERAGLEYNVNEVWDVESRPDVNVLPPHIENIIVLRARRLKKSPHTISIIRRYLPPVTGATDVLFGGLAQASMGGALYLSEGTGLPGFSTQFWVPDQPLQLDFEGKRIRYRYPTPEGGRTLTFVGFQEPVEVLPAGTLLRVSLAHWWRPKEKPDEELRCFVQLSGWFVEGPIAPVAGGLQDRHSAADESRIPKDQSASLFANFNRHDEDEVETPPAPEQQDLDIPESASRATRQKQLSTSECSTGGLPRARQVLKDTFGFADFLPLQADIVARVLERQDTLAIMPTGGGKSLCYQLPALLFQGLTVVVSPLIALMQDQVSQLQQLDVPSAFLNSTLAHREYVTIANRARAGGVNILYVAPETLLRPETLLLLEQSRISCLAVDEAHCISEWGHDFRPEYRQLQTVRQRFVSAVCLALTATATPRVRDDIRRLLGIPHSGEFIASFNRPNLFLSVRPRRDGLAQVLTFLKPRQEQSGIIYCATRKQVDELTAALNANGYEALPYHAGLADEVRRVNQDRFIRDEFPIMVATIAFGMGINKSNVRFVVHYHLPKDLESYYQEIGRGGRDGLPADCLLLYSRGDAVTIRHFIDEGAPSERAGRQARLNALMRYAEARECRRKPLLAYFGETLEQPCGHCDQCHQAPDPTNTTDVTVAAQKFLSCVKRTGELFGPAHIIAVLRGSKSERILTRGHDHLSTYGIGAEHSTETWRELAQQFIQLGLVDQDLEHGGLRLTPKGWEVLRGKQPVQAVLQKVEAPILMATTLASREEELFQLLRELRRELATEAGMPPYIIFSDRALTEMATLLPQTEAQLLAVNGVGRAKLANYGAAFLELIRDYCRQRGLEVQASSPSEPPDTIIRPAVRRRFREIGELFTGGVGIDEIATQYGIKRETVVGHLTAYREAGERLEPDRLLAASRLDTDVRERVFMAFDRLGTDRLAPVHADLSGRVEYDELHLLRLVVLSRKDFGLVADPALPVHSQNHPGAPSER
jgi:ATP-dependent DNA helicase RecQ